MGMGGGQSQSTTEHKEVRLPPWVEQAGMENWQFAKKVANRPLRQYTGETVAGLDPLYYGVRNDLGSLDDYYGNYADASAGLKGILNYNPQDIAMRSVTAPKLTDVDLSRYMNPYINAVESNTLARMGEQGLRDQRALASAATKSGGLGGSRQGIQQAVQGAKTVQAMGDTSAKLRSEGFDRATALAQHDLDQQYNAAVQTGNWQQAAEIESRRQDLAAHQQTIDASGQLTRTADAAQAAKMNEMATRLGIGQMAQEQRQRQDDARARMWQQRQDYPLEQLSILLGSLGIPYGHTEDSTSTTKSSGGGMQGLGQALGLGFNAIKGIAGLMPLLSDRSTKMNIEKLDDSGPVPIYAYDYKADVVAAKKAKRPMPPKRVGPMAQDIEQVAPALIKRVGGKRVIDLSALAEA